MSARKRSPTPVAQERPDSAGPTRPNARGGSAGAGRARRAGRIGNAAMLDRMGQGGGDHAAIATQATSGRPGPLPHRAAMEDAFGVDLGGVTAYTDPVANEALSSVGSSGVAMDGSVAFATPNPSPDLVAHEIAHFLEGMGGGGGGDAGGDPESRADAAAHQFRTQGQVDPSTLGSASGRVPRFEDPPCQGLCHAPNDRGTQDSPFGDFQFPQLDNNQDPFGTTPSWQPTTDPFAPPDSSAEIQALQQAETRLRGLSATNWEGRIQEQAGPDTPSNVSAPSGHIGSLAAPATVPSEIFLRYPMCNGGHHQQDDPFGTERARRHRQAGQFWADDVNQRRQSHYSAFHTKWTELAGTWNSVAGKVRTYNQASQDPSLVDVHSFSATEGPGDLSQVAEGQQVAGTRSTTVGSLFPQQEGGGPGTEADTTGVGDNLDRASRTPAIVGDDGFQQVKAADRELQAANYAYKGALDSVSAATHGLEAAEFGVQEVQAQENHEDAQSSLAATRSRAQQVKDGLGVVLGLIKMGVKVAEGKPWEAAGEAGPIANTVVDWFFSSEIDARQRDVDRAFAAYRTARHARVDATVAAKVDALSAAVNTLKSRAETVKARLADQQSAYSSFGNAVAIAGGGSRSEQDRIRGLIGAIPIVETVIGRADNIVSAIAEPAYSAPAGMGFALAEAESTGNTARFVQLLGQLRGYRTHFTQEKTRWEARRTSLRGVVNRASGGRFTSGS